MYLKRKNSEIVFELVCRKTKWIEIAKFRYLVQCTSTLVDCGQILTRIISCCVIWHRNGVKLVQTGLTYQSRFSCVSWFNLVNKHKNL